MNEWSASRSSRPANGRLKRFFHWLTRRTFQDLQIRDGEIAEYISDMLSRFARTDRLYKIRDAQGRQLQTVVDLLIEVQGGRHGIEQERDLFQYMGDYLLFMTGLFREYVEARGFFSYYMEEGPRAYMRVWEVDRGLFRPTAKLFERLWRAFEFHAGALYYMRKTFFREPRGDDPFESLHRGLLLYQSE